MKERGIIFSAPMVRALLSGSKSQTRRPVKLVGSDCIETHDGLCHEWPWSVERDDWVPCPYGEPGDELWVKETSIVAPADWTSDRETMCSQHVIDRDGRPRLIQYLATQPDREAANDYGLKASPSIFMPRWASRITLELTSVRVERLQDITPADAIAEGIKPAANCYTIDCDTADPRDAYRTLWESLHGPESWAASPWVWVLGFKVVQR